MSRGVKILALCAAVVAVTGIAWSYVSDSKEYSESYHVVDLHMQSEAGSGERTTLVDYEVRRDVATGEFYLFVDSRKSPVCRAFHPDSIVAYVSTESAKFTLGIGER